MNLKIKAQCEARSTIIKALAHPSRIFIVEKLAQGECCVCDLRKMIGVDISTVSKHLSTLKSAGLVQDEKRGAKVFYSLTMPCVLKFFECVNTVMKKNAERQISLSR